MLRRLRPLDRFLVLVVVPLWAVMFGLHVHRWLDYGIVEPGVYVTPASGPGDHPVVRALRESDPEWRSDVREGDVLLRLGDESLRGVGAIRFFAKAFEHMDRDQKARVVFRRDGETQSGWLRYTRMPLPIRFVLVSASFVGFGLLLVLRAPRSRAAGGLFRGLLLFSFAFLRPVGGPEELSLAIMAVLAPVQFVAAPGLLRGTMWVPDGIPRPGWWGWPLALVFFPIGPLYWNAIVGVPLFESDARANTSEQLSLALLLAYGVALIAVGTRNYLACAPVGRRQVKWMLLGLYVTVVPVLIATAISIARPEYWWLSDASEIIEVLIPIFFFVGVVRYNLFDIDRLISATASYSLLGGAFLALGIAFVPRLAQAAGDTLGMDAASGQTLFALGLTALAIGGNRLLQPRLDRWIFPERQALQRGIYALLQELPAARTPGELTTRAAEGLHELLRPETLVVYLRRRDCYEPGFARGAKAPPVLPASHPVIAALRSYASPLVSSDWARARDVALSPLDRAVLETLDSAILVPIRRGETLLAFVCLGPKRSGDIYTQSDLALVGALASTVGSELLRFDEAEILETGRALQESLRRYVPAPIADALRAGDEPDSKECEASVMFVDLRGYTAYSEGLDAKQIFAFVSRFSEVVSARIGEWGGTVVDFGGDGVMAVFGAPVELPNKETAAVQAGIEIFQAVASLRIEGDREPQAFRVGVGIATGPVFVGSVHSADRMIWSAVGNTTNLASRLEGLTRSFDAAMVVDDATARRSGVLQRLFERRESVPVRGRSEPLDLFVLPAPDTGG